MFDDLTTNEKLGWELGASTTLALIILVFVWTSNNASNRAYCLEAGGDWKPGGACILSMQPR